MIALPADVVIELDAAAQRHSVPRELARAIAWVESRGEQSARSKAGAIGVMQLMPGTAEALGVDPTDRVQNIEGGVRLLATLLERFDSDPQAIAAYVWGQGHVKARPALADWPESVKAYVRNVWDRLELERAELEGREPRASAPSATGFDMPRTGIRSFGFQRSTHVHNGVDFKAKEGDAVYAAAGGVVQHATLAWEQGFTGYGRVVVIEDDDGRHELYGHLSDPLVAEGQRVEAGELIGRAGRTAFEKDDHTSLLPADAAHTHFEVAEGSYPQDREAPRLDPIAWLEAGRVHPIAGVRLGGEGMPGPFVLVPVATAERLRSSRSPLAPSALQSRLLDKWASAETQLEELTALVGDAALRERLTQLRDELAALVDGARSSSSSAGVA